MSEDDPFRAIADPTRRRILDLLAERESLTVSELAAQFPDLVSSGISKHLMTLRAAGLVSAQKHGRTQRYSVDADGLARALAPWVGRYQQYWDRSLADLEALATADPVQAGPGHPTPAVEAVQVNLFCEDVTAALDFYRRLGLAEAFRTPSVGSPEHVEVEAAAVRIGLTSAAVANRIADLGVRPFADVTTELALWTDDVEALFALAVDAGAVAVTAPMDSPDGRLRSGWVRDPQGHQLKLIQQR